MNVAQAHDSSVYGYTGAVLANDMISRMKHASNIGFVASPVDLYPTKRKTVKFNKILIENAKQEMVYYTIPLYVPHYQLYHPYKAHQNVISHLMKEQS